MERDDSRDDEELRRRLAWLVDQRWWIVALFVVLQSASNFLARRPVAPVVVATGLTLLALNGVYAWRASRARRRELRVLAEVQLAVDVAAAAVAIGVDIDPVDAVGYALLVALVASNLVIPRRLPIVTVTFAVLVLLFATDFARVEPPERFRWLVATSATVLAAAAVGALNVRRQRLDEALRIRSDELVRAQAHLAQRERLAALGEMAAILAHEIRNPLGVLSNASALLAHEQLSTEERRELLTIVAEETQRLNSTVSQLLDFVRHPRPARRPLALGAVLRAALERARVEATTSGIRVEVRVADGLPEVPLDEELFMRAIVNLAANAIAAMPEGGLLRLDASLVESAKVIRVTMRDSGTGVDEKVLPHLFEPFFTTKATGTGLGLAIVKRIIESHDGRIAIESGRGEGGTTVTIDLPTAP